MTAVVQCHPLELKRDEINRSSRFTSLFEHDLSERPHHTLR